MRKLATYLPEQLANNNILAKIVPYIQQANCMFSSILYCHNNKKYLINKNQHFPYIAEDWHMYCIMRGWAKTLIQGAGTIRYQRDLFKDRGSCGDKIIEDYYNNILKDDKQNIYVLSRQDVTNEMKYIINEKYYTLINADPTVQQAIQRQNQEIQIGKTLHNLIKKGYAPIILQCGLKTFKNYHETLAIKQSQGIFQPNAIQLIILTQYQGHLHEDCIGNSYDIDMDTFYDLKWVSQKIKIQLKNGEQASLVFKVYLKK